MKKKKLLFWSSVAVIYCMLLLILVAVESQNPDSSISSFPQAVWYSLVTMTTVGYGDLYPVTAIGCVIGALFLLCSAGALTAVISLGVHWVTGAGLPRMQVRSMRGRKTYVFDRNDATSEFLSASIRKEEPDACCIISTLQGNRDKTEGNLYVPIATSDVLRILKNKSTDEEDFPVVVFSGPDAKKRMISCSECADARVICESREIPEMLSDRVLCYDPMELKAYDYWHKYPLAMKDQTVVLIGFGELGRAVLEHGLQRNVLTPYRNVCYHVVGDGSDFLRDHNVLSDTVSIGERSDSRDSLIFRDEEWNSSAELLLNAERIIICDDDEARNIEIYRRMKTYFPVRGKVHVYCSSIMEDNYPLFGMDQETCTASNLFRPHIDQLAKKMHEIYRSSADYPVPAWNELSAFLRRSNQASAEHAAEKLRLLLHDDRKTDFTAEDFRQGYEEFLKLQQMNPDLCREIEHNRWRRFHSLYNWTYAPARDNETRVHPLLVDYSELSPENQVKNDYSWELLGKM